LRTSLARADEVADPVLVRNHLAYGQLGRAREQRNYETKEFAHRSSNEVTAPPGAVFRGRVL